MKCLLIQLQPDLCAGDAQQIVDDLTSIATNSDSDASLNVEHGDDNRPYINVNIHSTDVMSLWSAVSSRISCDSALASCAIVCCEGDDGWDDYLLLHHYDQGETLDTLS